MGLFKRKDKKTIPMIDSWEKLSIRKLKQISEIDEEISDLMKQMELISILADMDIDVLGNLPIDEYADLAKRSQFLNKECPTPNKIRKHINLNGRDYDIVTDPRKLNAAQFIDFNNLRANDDMRTSDLSKFMTVFIVPKGKVYGEYDMEAVENDLLDMSVVEARGIFFSWQKVLMASVMGIGNYLERKKRKMRKTYVPMRKGEEMISEAVGINHLKKSTKRGGAGNQ